MKYLIFETHEAAEARSIAAYEPMRPLPEPEGTVTSALWTVTRMADGRSALMIPDTPAAAGISLSQQAYDDLLSEEERGALVHAAM